MVACLERLPYEEGVGTPGPTLPHKLHASSATAPANTHSSALPPRRRVSLSFLPYVQLTVWPPSLGATHGVTLLYGSERCDSVQIPFHLPSRVPAVTGWLHSQ